MAHESTQRAIEMFGYTQTEVEDMKPARMGPGMWAMSILSDIQAHMEVGAVDVSPEAEDHIRKGLNMAKYWIEESRHVESDNPRDR